MRDDHELLTSATSGASLSFRLARVQCAYSHLYTAFRYLLVLLLAPTTNVSRLSEQLGDTSDIKYRQGQRDCAVRAYCMLQYQRMSEMRGWSGLLTHGHMKPGT